MTGDASNQREFTRVPMGLRVEVEIQGRRIVDGRSGSLSLKGIRILSAESPDPGTPCEVTILLEGGDIRVEAQGRVVNAYTDGFAVQFDRIMGVESYEHLRNLVLYNAADTETVEQEFQEHTGLRRRN